MHDANATTTSIKLGHTSLANRNGKHFFFAKKKGERAAPRESEHALLAPPARRAGGIRNCSDPPAVLPQTDDFGAVQAATATGW